MRSSFLSMGNGGLIIYINYYYGYRGWICIYCKVFNMMTTNGRTLSDYRLTRLEYKNFKICFFTYFSVFRQIFLLLFQKYVNLLDIFFKNMYLFVNVYFKDMNETNFFSWKKLNLKNPGNFKNNNFVKILTFSLHISQIVWNFFKN